MKFECDRKAFSDALRIVGRAATDKPDIQFHGIHLRLAGDGARLETEATNGEISIAATVPTTYPEEQGEVLVPGGILQGIIGRMDGGELSFQHDAAGGLANIVSGKARFSIHTQSTENYPSVPCVMDDTVGLDIDREALSAMVRKTAFAASKDDTRPVFTGCRLAIHDGRATMAATNGHRLAIMKCDLSSRRDMQGLILPAAALQEAVRILKSDIGARPYLFQVKSTAGVSRIGFDFGDVRMTSRLIAGQFPDVGRVIPKAIKTTATMRREEFTEALERVSIIAKSADYHVVRLEFASEQVRLASTNSEVGNAEETIRASVSGEDMQIAFNVHYLIEALKILDGEKFTMEMGGSLTPCKITDDDPGFLYVVTPVRTSS